MTIIVVFNNICFQRKINSTNTGTFAYSQYHKSEPFSREHRPEKSSQNIGKTILANGDGRLSSHSVARKDIFQGGIKNLINMDGIIVKEMINWVFMEDEGIA